jgi:hypothetical protein
MAHDKPESAKSRVARWRAKKRAVTRAATIARDTTALGAVADCTKCNGHRLCPEHAKLVDKAAGSMAKGAHLNRNDVVTGGYGHNETVMFEKLRRANEFPEDDAFVLLMEGLASANDDLKVQLLNELRTVARGLLPLQQKAHPNESADQLWERALERAFEIINGVKAPKEAQ